MYTIVGLFFVYLYCLDTFLGEWLKYVYSALSEFSNDIGFWQLGNTIDSLGYQSINGGGMFATAIILSLVTSGLLGREFLQELDARAN